ncbi:class I SAM-dependent methyltransferase [candidate division CSSED10-310 bacterium]|uniref:Class I SAM-dependent methyltransferase n=1 Tax=candidate division CSSED10-310 bacterium TaxID=2855610 RepID=A0ABV6Z0X4_UNCC1
MHFASYGIERLRQGGTMLSEIELKEIGPVTGKKLLHLQCHIGTDTLSWVQAGALVTGVDFSAQSLTLAAQLRDELHLEARFIQANVYELKQKLEDTFDIVYTSRGVLCWLRDLSEWAGIISHYLKPGGIFYIMETHPTCMIFDEEKCGKLEVKYSYFHQEKPLMVEGGTPDYADQSYCATNPTYEWNWSLSDIINSLIKAGLVIEFVHEYDQLFYQGLKDMVQTKSGWWYLPDYEHQLPFTFSLRARKT